ncbi:MAG: hypothetical protein K8R87_11080 [Verrucomicrobia bacterium]|nr:hypothetical protein [Verrucomicrobiota bacterium]
MRQPQTLLPLVAAVVLFSPALVACIWDSDTLAAERARFPEIAELITGSFARHSKEFHAWRLLRSEALIAEQKGQPATFDDLAVSQHKLGDHKAAIATMEKKELLFPGQYETLSNLGTFYIYTGELDKAQQFIRKALVINANAHFGREKYQLWLVEWLQQRKSAPKTVEDQDPWGFAMGKPHGFAEFIAKRERGLNQTQVVTGLTLTPKQQSDALRGLMGMMWFADFDNPVLLEALGDVLIAGEITSNAAQLAALSYLHASQVAPDVSEKTRLRKFFEAAGKTTMNFKTTSFEELLKRGLTKGKAYYEGVRNDEIEWLKQGVDVEIEFQKKYLRP